MRFAIPIAILLTLTITNAAANGCPTEEATVTLETPHGTYYVLNEPCQPDCVFSIWVYEESNGKEGLQRDDWFCNEDGTCDCWESDTIIF